MTTCRRRPRAPRDRQRSSPDRRSASDGKNSECGIPALRAARLRVAGIDDEAVQPRVEALGIAEGRKVPPRAEQRLLAGILGAVLVAQDSVREGVAAIDVARGQRCERVAIACCCPNYEILLLHPSRPLGWRPPGRFNEYGAGQSRNVQGSCNAIVPRFLAQVSPRDGGLLAQEVCRHG